MADFITSDRTFKVGDLVYSNYNKGDFLYRVTKITRRFLTKDDLRYQTYSGGVVGDEYNPYIECEVIENLSISADPKKKLRKKSIGLDAAWLIKADPFLIEAHIKKLNDILVNIFHK